MAERLYNIVFSGQILKGEDLEQVKLQLAKIFKADSTKVDSLFAGNHVSVTRGITKAVADKYTAAFKNAGAVCEVVEVQTHTDVESSGRPEPQSPSPSSIAKTANDTREVVIPESNTEKDAALLNACAMGRLEVAKQLIAHGANVNYEECSRFPLLDAASSGYKDIVAMLLDNGAKINKREEYGDTALKSASNDGQVEVVKLLIARGADVNLACTAGESPLMMAALSKQTDVVDVLVANGANVKAKDINGKTAVDRGKEWGNASIRKILKTKPNKAKRIARVKGGDAVASGKAKNTQKKAGFIGMFKSKKRPGMRDPVKSLEYIAFVIKPSGVELPKGDQCDERTAFLERICRGRRDAVQYRADMMENFDRQARAQGVPNFAELMPKDPVDKRLPGWYSLGIMFDWDKMDSSYGIQAFKMFFERIAPDMMSKSATVFFGDLIQFESMCAIVVTSKSADVLAYIADRFGPEVEGPGLLPHSIRFMMANKKDGHLIPRTFSLPIAAELKGGRVIPDPNGGVDWIISASKEDTPWE
jgi:ankyrin repeat protein